jgi:hypothetical protein
MIAPSFSREEPIEAQWHGGRASRRRERTMWEVPAKENSRCFPVGEEAIARWVRLGHAEIRSAPITSVLVPGRLQPVVRSRERPTAQARTRFERQHTSPPARRRHRADGIMHRATNWVKARLDLGNIFPSCAPITAWETASEFACGSLKTFRHHRPANTGRSPRIADWWLQRAMADRRIAHLKEV